MFQIYWVSPLCAGFLTSVFYQLVFDRKEQLKPEISEEVPLTGVVTGDIKSKMNSRQTVKDTNQSSGSNSK